MVAKVRVVKASDYSGTVPPSPLQHSSKIRQKQHLTIPDGVFSPQTR